MNSELGTRTRYLVVSDLHADDNAYIEFVHALHSEKYDMVILNGDVCDTWRFSLAWNKMYIKRIIKTLSTNKVPWKYIIGNHDAEMWLHFSSDPELMPYAENISAMYIVGSKTTNLIFLHGHQAALKHYTASASFFKRILLKAYTRYIRFRHPQMQHKVEELATMLWDRLAHDDNDALESFISKEFHDSVIVCGHTHIAVDGKLCGSNVYANSGTLLEPESTYAIINF